MNYLSKVIKNKLLLLFKKSDLYLVPWYCYTLQFYFYIYIYRYIFFKIVTIKYILFKFIYFI